ncbi:MAG: branched-chain amino acid ABC transporter substrate-binding protein [Alphaproteobacteria bacterium HGW-Alphaproteobacteria-1]|jgi:ABC transporter substrate binding protein (PQQ-dependent alcohol dehydrogenase system)|nr:MAG: branched-chain amino acid ABC transporter substrate-binding protein [Alphaproteobacteria bacterium HGW-Alphaproteobacteria-1]
MSRWQQVLCALMMILVSGHAVRAAEVRAAVLRVDYPRLLPVSRHDLRADDIGFAGAVLADEDNGTTGRFLGHGYLTTTHAVTPDNALGRLDEILAEGVRLVVVQAGGAELLRLADRAAEAGALVFNASAPETELRDAACRANLLHVAPSNQMLADAVAQFAVWKKWREWLLVTGSNPADRALGEAFRRAAGKFGAKLVEERVFEDTGGSRRTDSGHVLVQRQLPLFTQGAKAHDVVIAADATDYFAGYLPYHLWTPRPVMGSGGLRPVSMHPAHEAWGATQFQTRFEKLTQRRVASEDYNVWLALRVIGEAVTRTGSAEPEAIRAYALSDAFELAAFKGQKVTFRDWNGQLRQPILLYDGWTTVSVSPQEGFLHQVSPLDTLGLDRPESACTAFN